jgi:uncharacterized repeat protein (TIGR03803 family)
MSKIDFLAICLVLALAAPVHAQTYKVLHNFGSSPGEPSCPTFEGAIAQSLGGNFYSSAPDCFSTDGGTVYKISVNGALTVIYRFPSDLSGPRTPVGGLVLGTDQQFHGTTKFGGINNFHGGIFRVTPGGKFTTMHEFNGDVNGGAPVNAPIQSVSGNYYGTTPGEYGLNWGSIYKITENGNFTLLHAFNGADGAYAQGPLIQGTDYNFYGNTGAGGPLYDGVIFRVTAGGDYKVLHTFDGTDGEFPAGPLIQTKDGTFYGTAYASGSGGAGVIFQMTPDFQFSVLYSFSAGADGGNPAGGLVEASDGNLYGTNTTGGANGHGVIFRITPAGAFTVLHDFRKSTGILSQGTLIQHTNGKLYGQTTVGGSAGHGVFFRLDAGLPPFVKFLTVYGRVGAHVVILGQGFTPDSVVSFNGVPAVSPEIHPTFIKAIVPDGATTGPITVTTANGTLTSNKVFMVHP